MLKTNNFRSFLFVLVMIGLTLPTLSEVPQSISYQGRLTDADGTAIEDGSYLLKFIIYDDLSIEKWNSQFQTVVVTEGLFSVELGASPMTPLPHDLFEDTLLYLGITIGTNPELTPRTRLVSTGYAYHALRADTAAVVVGDPYIKKSGDQFEGSLYGYKDGIEHTMTLDPYESQISLFLDGPENKTIQLSGQPFGLFSLYDNNGVENVRMSTSTFSGVISLYSMGSLKLKLDAGAASQDDQVDLPDSSINASETFQEPGIAHNRGEVTVEVTYTSNTDCAVDSISITVPAAGYIVVQASGEHEYSHITGTGNSSIIRTSLSKNIDHNWYTESLSASNSIAPSGSFWSPFNNLLVDKVNSGGTYKYYLSAYKSSTTDYAAIHRTNILATYYPTNYGTVEVSGN